MYKFYDNYIFSPKHLQKALYFLQEKTKLQ